MDLIALRLHLTRGGLSGPWMTARTLQLPAEVASSRVAAPVHGQGWGKNRGPFPLVTYRLDELIRSTPALVAPVLEYPL